jgi:hypothetical protein
MKDASGVDDDSLAGHGFSAAHRGHHVSAVLVAGFFSSDVDAGRSFSGRSWQSRGAVSGRYAVDERLGPAPPPCSGSDG